jgi:hypothetical protein
MQESVIGWACGKDLGAKKIVQNFYGKYFTFKVFT